MVQSIYLQLQNLPEAREWFQKSAKQGDIDSKFYRAMMADQRPEDPFDFLRGHTLLSLDEFRYCRGALNLLGKLSR